MENNKAYLQRIHWVFLIAFLNTLALYFIQPWLFDQSARYNTPHIISTLLLSSVFYIALGIIISKWKQAGIAFALHIVIQFIVFYISKSNTDSAGRLSFDLTTRLIFLFIQPLPVFLFVALQAGWVKKLWWLYGLVLLQSLSSSLNFYGSSGIRMIAGAFSHETRDLLALLVVFIVKTALFIFEIILICEIINLIKGKTYTNKPTLLNLGNEYKKLNNIITFWALKVSLFVVILGSAGALNGILEMMESNRFSYRKNNDLSDYFLYTGVPVLVSYISLAIFLAWYLRKFLLEIFVSFGIHSKFLYWLCLLPVIGFFAFLILQLDSLKQQRHSEKVNTIGLFAGSSTAVITGFFFVAIVIRMLMRIAGGDPTFVVSLGISIGLFIWLISSKTGYLVSLWIVGVCLLVLLMAAFLMKPASSNTQEMFAIAFALFMLNLVQLILIYPVYHFEEFQYMPAEDPEAPPHANEAQVQLFS